jgi:hypothetical protein
MAESRLISLALVMHELLTKAPGLGSPRIGQAQTRSAPPAPCPRQAPRGSKAPYSAKILAGPLDQVILMSPPFGVTGSPVTPVSI